MTRATRRIEAIGSLWKPIEAKVGTNRLTEAAARIRRVRVFRSVRIGVFLGNGRGAS
jgi:hypothetical protein